jgi:DNA-binding response OmpR family regulator
MAWLLMLPLRGSVPIAVAAITASPQVARAGAEVARQSSFVFQLVGSSALAIELARSGSVALLILDLRVSGVDSRLVDQIRRAGFREPLICAGAPEQGGSLPGADDLIPAGVRGALLVGRIAARFRAGSGVFARLFAVGELALDPAARRVTVRERPVRLTPAEYALLLLLVTRAGRVVSKEEIALVVLASPSATQNAYFHVHNLKHKLGTAGCLIQTDRGNGYRLSLD